MAMIHNNYMARDAKKGFVSWAEEAIIESFFTEVEIQSKHLDALKKKTLDNFVQPQIGDE